MPRDVESGITTNKPCCVRNKKTTCLAFSIIILAITTGAVGIYATMMYLLNDSPSNSLEGDGILIDPAVIGNSTGIS